MLDKILIDSLFPGDLPDPQYWESFYPPRQLPSEAVVTRFGPSPTGFVHIGGVYTALIAKDLAHKSGGVYFIRIEDTDQSREVEGALEQFRRAFAYFSIESDEDDENAGWGPYAQSRRYRVYASYVRDLLYRDLAYLCFCSRDDLASITERQRVAKVPTGYYGEWARCRNLSADEVTRHLASGDPYTVRFRSPGDLGKRVTFTDQIRGTIELEDNRNDIVILKSSEQLPQLPTYHFAHPVDDHLMRVNLVLRGEEWISSVPLHLQLFDALGFPPIPYAHIAPLMKMEGTSKRKLSKRKDPEANVDYYIDAGYPTPAVLHYLRGLANARLADLDPEVAKSEPIRLQECSVAGPLVDLAKLDSVSRNIIAGMTDDAMYYQVRDWARVHDRELAHILEGEQELAIRALGVERHGMDTPRKDLGKWSDFRQRYGFFFPELFSLVDDAEDSRFGGLPPTLVRSLAADLCSIYEHSGDRETWFMQIRDLASRHGFAASVSEYRKTPDAFPGSIREVANVVRVLMTGVNQSPDLYQIAQALGRDEVVRRVKAVTE